MEKNNKQTERNKSEVLKRLTDFCKKNAAYLILAVCLGISALAIMIIAPGMTSNEEGKTGEKTDNYESVGRSEDERLNDFADSLTEAPEKTLKPVSTAAPDFTKAPNPTPTKRVLKNPPVSGEIIFGFAVNELIYSVTLDQWTTHSGIDIAAPLGSEVLCVDSGEVVAVYCDSGLGQTVIIKHKDGSKSIYANLSEEFLPKEGNKVNCGDIIGKVGKTAAFESELAAHLHFEYHVNDCAVDPAEYFLIKKK